MIPTLSPILSRGEPLAPGGGGSGAGDGDLKRR
jgi:hypothetical protein